MQFFNTLSRISMAGLLAIPLAVAFDRDANAEGTSNNLRVELGAGVQAGDPTIEFAGLSEDLDTDTGYAITGAVWVDGVMAEFVSLGFQYLRLDGADFNQTATGTFLGATLTGTVDITTDINAFMANAALRKNDGRFHPYVGGGVGVALTNSEISATVTVVVNGQTFSAAGSDSDSHASFAGQVFGGADYDVSDEIYVGINGRYFITNADLFGADVAFRTFAVMAVVGFRF